MKPGEKKIAFFLGAAGCTYLGLLLSPYLKEGLPGLLSGGEINPFRIYLCPDSFRSVLLFDLLYLAFSALLLSERKNFRYGEEHGSASWGDVRELRKKYADPDPNRGIILTENISISNNTRKHRRNLNVLVCGGSGAGKTRFYAKPNILNCDQFSFCVLDPNRELRWLLFLNHLSKT